MSAAHHFARISQARPVEPRDILDYADAREGARLIAAEACGALVYEAEPLPAKALDVAARIRFTELATGLEHVALVSCTEHYEGRDWVVEVIRTLRDGQDVRTAGGVEGRIADWCERERLGAAREVWEVCR